MSAGSTGRPHTSSCREEAASAGTRGPGGRAAPAPCAPQRRGWRARRFACRVLCRVRELGGASRVVLEGQTVNISGGGLALLVGRALERGARVEVLLPSPDGSGIRLTGEVAHSRRVLSGTYEVGVRLERVTELGPIDRA